MAKIFWASCPNCGKDFYGARELRVKDLDMRCPYCKHMFKPSQASKLVE
ncbi:MAG: zinc ribbon domain-containing protein [Thermodesulfobacteriota bacterium]